MEAKDLLGPAVTLLGFFVVNFIADSYRRFKSGSVLAAGLAGELRSYLPAQVMLVSTMNSIIEAHSGVEAKKLGLSFRGKFEMPKDRVYEANVANLGLLGSDLAADTANVYGQILGFRTAWRGFHDFYEEMNVHESREQARFIRKWLENCDEAGKTLLPKLEERARASWITSCLAAFEE